MNTNEQQEPSTSPAKKAFRTRLPSKTESWSGENESIVGDTPQNSKVEDVKTKLSCETSFKMEIQDAKTKLSCQTSLQNWKFWKLKMWMLDIPQNLTVEDVKTKLSHEIPSKSESWTDKQADRQTARQTHTHTLAQNCHCEFCCEMHLTCKNNPLIPDRNGSVRGPEKVSRSSHRHSQCWKLNELENDSSPFRKFADCNNSAAMKWKTNRRAGSWLSRSPLTKNWFGGNAGTSGWPIQISHSVT